MLILNANGVRKAFSMSMAIEAMKEALTALSHGDADIPLRTHIQQLTGTTLVMPGLVTGSSKGKRYKSLAVKVVSIFNQNGEKNLPNIMGVVNVLDSDTGQPVALLDGAAITAIRTAATSAAATDALANPNANQLAIIGSGTQAKTHFEAVCEVRDIKRATFYSPNRAKVDALIASLDSDVESVATETSAEATQAADIVCTTTNSSTPVIDDRAIKPGCHINAIGSYKPTVVEIPSTTVLRSRIYIDHLESALAEAGDLIQPIENGEMKANRIVGEVGKLFAGEIAGRQSSDEVTLFKSVGNTVEDVVAAHLIVERARELGLGQEVDF